MKSLKYLALLSTLALLTPIGALARDKNEHSVSIPDAVQVGSAQLRAGTYKVKWDGTGPQVQVSFMRDGKTVATAPGTLKTNDTAVVQDDVVRGTGQRQQQEPTGDRLRPSARGARLCAERHVVSFRSEHVRC